MAEVFYYWNFLGLTILDEIEAFQHNFLIHFVFGCAGGRRSDRPSFHSSALLHVNPISPLADSVPFHRGTHNLHPSTFLSHLFFHRLLTCIFQTIGNGAGTKLPLITKAEIVLKENSKRRENIANAVAVFAQEYR